MAINYFMVTKDGMDLYADYPPLVQGVGPVTASVAGKVRKSTRVNLLPNGSFESNLNGWNPAGSGSAPTRTRSTAQAAAGSASYAMTANADGLTSSMGAYSGCEVTPGKPYLFHFFVRAGSTSRNVAASIVWNFGEAITDAGVVGTDISSGWRWFSVGGVAPAGMTFAEVNVRFEPTSGNLAANEVHYLDDVWFEEAQEPVITGVPADLAAYQRLFKAKGRIVEPRDIIAPTGFVQSVFRAVRDPGVSGDDSATALAMQIYNHGWVLSSALVSYLSEQDGYGGNPIPWPLDGGYKVVPVTGTPVVNDGAGTYGFQSLTWPGSAVGVGTLRQVVSGDEGSTRKVAAILDLLAAVSNVQRDTIESTYLSTKAAVDAAHANLFTVVSGSSDTVREPVQARSELAWYLACQAVDAPRGPSLENALLRAMQAVVAKEAGLIGATFTTANYETMTQPIDAVLAMPSGY